MGAFGDNLGDFRLFSTSTVAAWPVEAGNEADFHGVYVPWRSLAVRHCVDLRWEDGMGFSA